MNYPLLSIKNKDDAIVFKNSLSSKFESNDLSFAVTKEEGWYGVELMDEISPDLYSDVYQYAQKIFRDFYK